MDRIRTFVIGLIGACIGAGLALIINTKPDTCQARISSAHVSICLDSKIDKAKALFR
ncbi:hypothetical protein ACQR1W_31395 [Bradyrhizobium sp. HKCCYLS1011]|uniref:hypothetical protein n=1 Tax=Bradyrhizobium sp. HKCCYLS1011 TaxID=3420733 RepID=UPI003EBCE5A8